MSIYLPAQPTAPDQVAAPAAPAPVAAELGWGRVLRVSAARGSLALVLSLVLWSLLPLVVGWTPRVILSGSMEPRIHVGDIIVTRTVPAATLAKGQVITVKDPDHPAKTRTHRLLRREADGMLVLRGDANAQPDSSKVSVDDVLGLGVVRVPYVGRPAYWLAEGNWLALGTTSLFLGWCVITVLPGSRRSEDRLDEQGPTGPACPERHARTRRVAATVAVAAVAVGVGTASADAAFTRAMINPISTLSAATNFHPYKTAVIADSPYLFWRLDETSGTGIDDAGTGSHDGTLLAQTYTQGQTGALDSEPGGKSLGLSLGVINANNSVAGPNSFSIETWVKTGSKSGGPVVSFGDETGSDPSNKMDRVLYLAPGGKVMLGMGKKKTTIVSNSAINNNSWHHVVATFKTGKDGMKLYVDGEQQDDTGTGAAQPFPGYWRVGADQITGWPSNPTDTFFEGSLDEVAIYTSALSPARVLAHYNAAGS